MKRELVEEAALQIDVLKPLYLSENLFVESGEYRHEVILYFLAAVHAFLDTPPVDLRNHEWHPPSATPRPLLLPADVAEAVIFDLETGFRAPAPALRVRRAARRAARVTKGVRRAGKSLKDSERRRLGKARRADRAPEPAQGARGRGDAVVRRRVAREPRARGLRVRARGR